MAESSPLYKDQTPKITPVKDGIPRIRPLPEKKPGVYDFLSWKEKVCLYAAVVGIGIGSTALSLWITEGGITLESRLRSGRTTIGEQQEIDRNQYGQRRNYFYNK